MDAPRRDRRGPAESVRRRSGRPGSATRHRGARPLWHSARIPFDRFAPVAYLYLALAVSFNVAAYAVFKHIAHRPHTLDWALLFGAGLALGGINTFCFTAALRTIRLAVAYPVFAGASIAGVVAVSTLAFREQAGAAQLAGAALVVAGIVLLAR